jgi:hypothetical protein
MSIFDKLFNNKEMTTNKDYTNRLDSVLKILYDKKDYIIPIEILKMVKDEFGKEDLTLIIDKLLYDNYIVKKEINGENNNELRPPYCLRINYSGLLFSERGGYKEEKNILKKEKCFIKLKTWAYGLNAILVLIIAFSGVYVSYDSKEKDKKIENYEKIIEKYEKIIKKE